MAVQGSGGLRSWWQDVAYRVSRPWSPGEDLAGPQVVLVPGERMCSQGLLGRLADTLADRAWRV